MADNDFTTKELERIKRRENYLKNKDRILANNAKSRAKNRDAILKGKKDYYERVKLNPEWQAKELEKRKLNKENKKKYDAKYHELNKLKKIDTARKWVLANKDKRSVISFNYDSKRRALKKAGSTSKEILEWKSIQKKICYWCGLKCDDNFHIDHYEPLSKGGKHELSNLVISCPNCNLTKNSKDPYKFALVVGRLF